MVRNDGHHMSLILVEEEEVYFSNTQGNNRTINGHVQHNKIANKHSILQTLSQSRVCKSDLMKAQGA